jgi:hypothetical protein
VEPALNIASGQGIRPGLVFDKSLLNTSRILVGWLSPNYWTFGFRYGNIKFDYDFKALIQNKKFYWVEAITQYKPPACRILITDIDRSNQLTPYDPTIRDGPWWHDISSDTHYYNGMYCLEFMIEDQVPIDDLEGISFVKHHGNFCSIMRDHPYDCPQIGAGADSGGARFLITAAARSLNIGGVTHLFLRPDGRFKAELLDAIERIPRELTFKCHFGGKIHCSDHPAPAVARGALNALISSELKEAAALGDMFDTMKSFHTSIAHLVHEALACGDVEEIKNALL